MIYIDLYLYVYFFNKIKIIIKRNYRKHMFKFNEQKLFNTICYFINIFFNFIVNKN